MRAALILWGCLVFAGCAQTSYRTMDSQSVETSSPFSREVEYQVTNTLFEDPPDCIIVWPPAQGNGALEDAVVGHLSTKVSHVIGFHEAERLARKGAYDIAELQDRQTFARAQRCRFELDVGSTDQSSTYLMVWAQHAIHLDVSLRRIDDGALLWRARHSASKGEGGLPLSPVSVAINVVQAGVHQSDTEASMSVMGDGLRRIFRTLPDTRW
ncbi:MAG: hypothetical protein HQL36_01480 [Alphaproteobacteria bacterium]|nr:hypothetical protein [Alphaproteobacteria bacterium]